MARAWPASWAKPQGAFTIHSFNFFEDAGPVSKDHSANIVAFVGVLGAGAELDSKFVIATHQSESGDAGRVPTDDPAWKLIIESFGYLAEGIGPDDVPPECTVGKRLRSKPLVLIDGCQWSMICLFGKPDMEKLCAC